MNKTTNKANWEAAYKHFVKYSSGECRFCDLDVAYCQKFVDYLCRQSAIITASR